ncbi:MAG: hypothetical protein JNM65_01165 [Verrucomicrobiaceae bacterium]|nr:hypothetical protein [Verrucomicrobiaceae bacterium]
MNTTRSLLTILTVLLLASGCTQTTPPGDRPALKDYDNAPAAGPLFLPFR